MSTLKLEHIAHIDNAGPDISIDASGHLNIVNGNLQMGGVTMLDASSGDFNTGNNASFNVLDVGGEVSGRIRNWSSPTNSIAIESDPLNSAAGSYLTFTVDGAQKMTILGNNVGIGTTNPLRKIHISDAGDTHLVLQSTNATNDYEIFEMGVGANSNSKVDLTFRTRNNSGTGGSEVMRLSNDGNVHLNEGLDVRIQLGTSGTGATSVSDNSVYVRGNDDDLILGAAGNGNIFFKENADTRMTIEPGGNVGIGTTNPTSKLHTDGAIVSTSLAQGSGELQIQGYGNTGYINMNGSGSLIFRMGSSYSQDLKLTSAGILQGSSDAEIKTSPIRKHSNTISTNTTIDSSENAIASGPISVATGVTLTINGNMTVV